MLTNTIITPNFDVIESYELHVGLQEMTREFNSRKVFAKAKEFMFEVLQEGLPF